MNQVQRNTAQRSNVVESKFCLSKEDVVQLGSCGCAKSKPGTNDIYYNILAQHLTIRRTCQWLHNLALMDIGTHFCDLVKVFGYNRHHLNQDMWVFIVVQERLVYYLGQTRFKGSWNSFALAMQLDGRVDQRDQEDNTVAKSALVVM